MRTLKQRHLASVIRELRSGVELRRTIVIGGPGKVTVTSDAGIGEIEVRYYGHRVAKLARGQDGRHYAELSLCGYPTVTTRGYLNAVLAGLKELPLFHQSKYEQYFGARAIHSAELIQFALHDLDDEGPVLDKARAALKDVGVAL